MIKMWSIAGVSFHILVGSGYYLTPAHFATAMLLKDCDKLEVITKPSSGFRSVGQYYHDFGQISDEQVIQIMNNSGNIKWD